MAGDVRTPEQIMLDVLKEEAEKLGLDFVEVVRCKDCFYRHDVENCSYGECIYAAHMVDDNDYCSYGQREKEDD